MSNKKSTQLFFCALKPTEGAALKGYTGNDLW